MPVATSYTFFLALHTGLLATFPINDEHWWIRMPNITRSALLLALLSLLAAPAALTQPTSPQETVLFGEISLSEWGGVQPASSHNAAINAGQSALFFPSASDPLGRQGFVRVVNRSNQGGSVSITAFDDAGQEHGPITLTLEALQTVHFNSVDFEDGNPAKGLPSGMGHPSQGDWRLELASELDFKVLSYIRTADGFVTSMHDVAPSGANAHRVAFFNPGSNYNQESLLRVVNPGDGAAAVSVSGVDDNGVAAPSGTVRFSIPPRAASVFTAAELEGGATGLTGSLGDGAGKWRLAVEADVPIQVMSLLATPTGHLTNLSTDPEGGTVEVDDTPPAPRIEVTGARSFKVHWTHSGQANETHAFDISVRLGRSGGWTEECRTTTYPSDGEQKLNLEFTVSRDIPDGTVIQGRWRYRGGSSCSSGSPASWSHVGEATVPGDGSGQAPDLVVAAAVDDSTPDVGQTFEVSATVRNAGGASSQATTVRYFRSTDSAISRSDTETATDSVVGLSPSGRVTEISLYRYSTPATYYFGACVDSVAGESNTANNCSDGVKVEVGGDGGNEPDLVVESVSVNDSTPDAGASFRLSATVRNRGDGQSGSTTLRYYRSSNSTISTSDSEVGTDPVGQLAASANSRESIPLTAPSTSGTYYYGACVDSVSGESSTANNCSDGVRVVVSDGGGGGGSGSEFNVGDTITNMPSGSWVPSIVGGGSFRLSGGSWTLTLRNNAYAQNRDYRWTCRSPGGCTVENRVVREGLIVEMAR